MPADRGERGLLPLACEVFSLANLHPIVRDKTAVLHLSGQGAPISGRYVEVAGTRADVNGLSDVLVQLGLPPALFAPVAWGMLDHLSSPNKHLNIPWSIDF